VLLFSKFPFSPPPERRFLVPDDFQSPPPTSPACHLRGCEQLSVTLADPNRSPRMPFALPGALLPQTQYSTLTFNLSHDLISLSGSFRRSAPPSPLSWAQIPHYHRSFLYRKCLHSSIPPPNIRRTRPEISLTHPSSLKQGWPQMMSSHFPSSASFAFDLLLSLLISVVIADKKPECKDPRDRRECTQFTILSLFETLTVDS